MKKRANKQFTAGLVKTIADQSKLEIGKIELEKLAEQFNDTLEIVKKLNNLDTSGVVETNHVTGIVNSWREDVVNPKKQLSQKSALSGSQRVHKGYFVVKGVFDEE